MVAWRKYRYWSQPWDLQPTIEKLFTKLFTTVFQYLELNGWADNGSWVQIKSRTSLGGLTLLP